MPDSCGVHAPARTVASVKFRESGAGSRGREPDVEATTYFPGRCSVRDVLQRREELADERQQSLLADARHSLHDARL